MPVCASIFTFLLCIVQQESVGTFSLSPIHEAMATLPTQFKCYLFLFHQLNTSVSESSAWRWYKS